MVTERFVLGSILLDEAHYDAELSEGDFSLEIHRRIWRRMRDLHERGEHIDRGTVADELLRHGELEGIGGLTCLVARDDGLPQLPHIDSYLQVLKDKGKLRLIMRVCSDLSGRCALACEDIRDIVASARELFDGLETGAKGYRSVADIPSVYDCGAGEVTYLREPELPRGALVALTGDSGSGKSTLAAAWCRDAGVPVLILDRENPLSVIRDRMERLGMKDGPHSHVWGDGSKSKRPNLIHAW